MTNSPVPANSLTPCPFGGNPKVAAQMGFPSCGIARPGPFFNDLNLAKPTSGGRKSRSALHTVRMGGFTAVIARYIRGAAISNARYPEQCEVSLEWSEKLRRTESSHLPGAYIPRP